MLTDELIKELYGDDNNFELTGPYVISFARAIEAESTAPLLARIAELERALDDLLAIRNDSQGVAGYHLNGDVAGWDEFQEVSAAESALSAAPAAQPDKVLVDLDVLEAAADSLGSFCSDHGWSDADMQNLDNLLAFIAQHKAKHGIKEQP